MLPDFEPTGLTCTPCGVNTFSNGTGACQNCDYNCQDCSNTNGHCNSCAAGFQINGIACDACVNNTFSPGGIANCSSCDSSCNT